MENTALVENTEEKYMSYLGVIITLHWNYTIKKSKNNFNNYHNNIQISKWIQRWKFSFHELPHFSFFLVSFYCHLFWFLMLITKKSRACRCSFLLFNIFCYTLVLLREMRFSYGVSAYFQKDLKVFSNSSCKKRHLIRFFFVDDKGKIYMEGT